MARPRKEVLPDGLHRGQPVKVTSANLKKPKLGIVMGLCRYNDGGIDVWLTGDSTPGHSVYACIKPEEGDTIQGIEIAKGHTRP